jgi:hypothetical protein
MTNKICLNCEKELAGKYCSGCGQKSDTHRITFKNFIFHDVLHGTLHFEKGMLFTAKHALIRPGKAALDYISGKRKRYYNVFYLILITMGLILFFRHFNDELTISQGREVIKNPEQLNEASKTLNEIFSQKSKIIIFLFVPFAALNSFILFRRKKLNLSENSIIAGMILLGMLLISALGNLFFYFDLILPFSDSFAYVASNVVSVLVIFQIGYGYYNAFGNDYSKLGIAYRILLFFALLGLEIMILFYIVFGFVTNWKFGTVSVSPF